MLQKTTQWVTDRLVERALPTIGGYLASALQRMLILGHVEHHNQLEEQARRYEAAGKPHLAKLLRDQAGQLSLENPFSSAPSICEQLTDGSGKSDDFTLTIPDTSLADKAAKKKTDGGHDDALDSPEGVI
ncbi:MAG: hypothetical protein KDB23_01980 [Planctomycetales bacterium]|nr:hypothetical protein [Planctomycetales bacterium]